MRSSILYKTMDARINDIRDDEIGLLFLPFGVQTDIEGHPFLTFATDTLQVVYDTLIEDKGYSKRIYFIYPGAEPNKVVIRDANNRGNREYIQTSIFAKLFEYKTRVEMEE